MSFWDLLKPAPATKAKSAAKPVTAAALELALAEAEAAAQAAEATAAEAAQRRAEQLLTADDATLDRVDRDLQLAQRAADKAAMAVEALRQRLATAQEAERQAERDTLYAKGQAALDAGLALYDEYGELAARSPPSPKAWPIGATRSRPRTRRCWRPAMPAASPISTGPPAQKFRTSARAGWRFGSSYGCRARVPARHDLAAVPADHGSSGRHPRRPLLFPRRPPTTRSRPTQGLWPRPGSARP